MTNKEKVIVLSLITIGILLLTFGIFNKPIMKFFSKKAVVVESETTKTTYQKGNILSLKDSKKYSDQDGMKQAQFQVKIENKTDQDLLYRVRMEEDLDNSSIVNRSDIKVGYQLDGETYIDFFSSAALDGTFLEGIKLAKKETIKLTVSVWYPLDTADLILKEEYKLKLVVDPVYITEEEAKDTVPPLLTLNGQAEMEVMEGDVFQDPFVAQVIDDVDGEIDLSNVQVKYEFGNGENKVAVSKIDTTQVGVYYITYTVKDRANNTTSKMRIVTVRKKVTVPDTPNPDTPSPENPNPDKPSEPSNPNPPEEPTPPVKMEVKVSYSTTEKTDQDVIVTITSNLKLYKLTGWTLSKDGLALTKAYSTNISGEVVVQSERGDAKIVQISIQNIDKTPVAPPAYEKPTITLASTAVRSNGIDLKITPSDSHKIAGYYFSCDGGTTWTTPTMTPTYTCKGLKQNQSYTVKGRALDIENNTIDATALTLKTGKLEMPTFTSNIDASTWATSKTVTIHYPTRLPYYLYQYKLSTDTNWVTLDSGTSKSITLTSNVTVTARVIDSLESGYNEAIGNYVEQRIDYQAPTLPNSKLTATSITTNSFQLGYQAATDNSTATQNLKYYVCLSTTNQLNGTTCKTTYVKNSGGTLNMTSYSFTGLTQNTTYYAAVLVEDQFGIGTMYPTITVTTEKEVVVPPKDPVIGIDAKLEISDKKDLVSILYSTWFNYMHDKTPSIFNVSLGTYGNVGDFHYWGKPALGYYDSTDKSVIRRHMTQLVDAGIDFIILDNSNVRLTWISNNGAFDTSSVYYKTVTAPVKALLDTIVEMRNEGLKTPYVVNWQNTEDGWVMANVFHNLFVSATYDPSLGNSKYEKVWVYWDNKPLMLTTTSGLGNPDRDITYRKMWGLQTSLATYEWSYLQKDNTKGGKDSSGKYEQMGVSVAMQQTRMTNTTTATGRNHGITFYNQWKNAFQYRPKIVTITWWNEWGAERLAKSDPACGTVTYCFTDNYNQEYSRDIEPMSGGHGDQYYQWLKQYVSAYKNNNTCPRLVESGY